MFRLLDNIATNLKGTEFGDVKRAFLDLWFSRQIATLTKS
jgi:hypothetical protein